MGGASSPSQTGRVVKHVNELLAPVLAFVLGLGSYRLSKWRDNATADNDERQTDNDEVTTITKGAAMTVESALEIVDRQAKEIMRQAKEITQLRADLREAIRRIECLEQATGDA